MADQNSYGTSAVLDGGQATALETWTFDLPGGSRLDVEGVFPCRSADPEAFFAESPADVEWAKSLCGTCPARVQCLTGALERQEPWGVWGGELFVNGEVVARKRPRGRPRKQVAEPARPQAPAAALETPRSAEPTRELRAENAA